MPRAALGLPTTRARETRTNQQGLWPLHRPEARSVGRRAGFRVGFRQNGCSTPRISALPPLELFLPPLEGWSKKKNSNRVNRHTKAFFGPFLVELRLFFAPEGPHTPIPASTFSDFSRAGGRPCAAHLGRQEPALRGIAGVSRRRPAPAACRGAPRCDRCRHLRQTQAGLRSVSIGYR